MMLMDQHAEETQQQKTFERKNLSKPVSKMPTPTESGEQGQNTLPDPKLKKISSQQRNKIGDFELGNGDFRIGDWGFPEL